MIAAAATSGLAGGLSASVAQIAELASKTGADLSALGHALQQGGQAEKPAEGSAQKPSKLSALETALVQPFLDFSKKLEAQLAGLPEQITGFLETAGKDALKAIVDPLKEIASSLFDSVFGGLFGGDKSENTDAEKADKKETSLGDKISKGLKGALDGLGKNLEGILGDLGKNFEGLIGGLGDSLGGLIGGIGDLFGGGGGGGIFGTILGGITKLFGFAGGGRIQPGVPAIVGERGPELIVPSRPGTVMNGADSRGAAGKSVAVSQTVNFDLVPGPTISAMIDAKKGEIERAAIDGTLKALNRGVI